MVTSGFNFVHAGFVFFAGIVHTSSGNPTFFPGWLAILSSLVNIAELVALLAFFMELSGKVYFLNFGYKYPRDSSLSPFQGQEFIHIPEYGVGGWLSDIPLAHDI